MDEKHERVSKESQPGIGVDAKGGAVIDPTINVRELVEAAIHRQDDLREAHEKLVNAELRHVAETAKLTRYYEEKLGVAESKRIDAIRAVDVGAVGIASERQNQQAAVLANQVSASAETLRTLVATTAASVQTALTQMTTQLTDRIALLEKSSYEGKGKQALSDPMMQEMMAKLDTLTQSRNAVAGKSEGSMDAWKNIERLLYVVLAIAGAFGLHFIIGT